MHCRGLTRWHMPDGTGIGSRAALQTGGIAAAPPAPPVEETGAAAAQAVETTTPAGVLQGEERSLGMARADGDATQGVEPEALPPAETLHPAEGRAPAAGGGVAEEPASGTSTAQAAGGSLLQRLLAAPPSMHAAALSQDGTVLYTGASAAPPLLISTTCFCYGVTVTSALPRCGPCTEPP